VPRSVYVEFVVDKVALGYFFSKFFGFLVSELFCSYSIFTYVSSAAEAKGLLAILSNVVSICSIRFHIQQVYFLPTECVYLIHMYLNSISQVIFVMETCWFSFPVGIACLNITYTSFRLISFEVTSCRITESWSQPITTTPVQYKLV
jgi:hypothetical protein